MKLAKFTHSGRVVVLRVFGIPIPVRVCKNAEQAKVWAER